MCRTLREAQEKRRQEAIEAEKAVKEDTRKNYEEIARLTTEIWDRLRDMTFEVADGLQKIKGRPATKFISRIDKMMEDISDLGEEIKATKPKNPFL